MVNFSVETYVLFLLVIGTLFLLFGLLLHFKGDERNAVNPHQREAYPAMYPPAPAQVNQTVPPPMPPVPPAPPMSDQVCSHGVSSCAPQENDEPDHLNRTDQEVEINIGHKNPQFLKKRVYLYFDHDRNNIYTGEENTSEINEIGNIKRVGLGTLSYDGASFKFSHQNRVQIFKVGELDYIAIYPNCIVIVSQKEAPTALFFMDETDSIRQLLDVFKS